MGNIESNPLMTLSEVAVYLKIAERTVLRLIHKGILPGIKVGNQWRFFKSIIDDWLISNIGNMNPVIPENENKSLLVNFLAPRYILPDIHPGEKQAILYQLIAPLVEERIINVPFLTIQKLMHRENISSTGIGNGVAFPHFRNPRENPAGAPPIIAGICREGTDYHALDGKPVRLFFLLCSNNESMHLNIMSRLGHLLIEETFRDSLIHAASGEEFIRLIREEESSQ
ncbi:MAG: PTS sugar transporter subunit IIA [Spirochaetales bacterium]|nr:PTS sugar transporter subunit IIA [Spirochaetales bacterium]